MTTSPYPTYDVDMYSDEVHADPHSHFKRLRDLGPAVWLTKNNVWAIPRYKELKECLRNTDVFISGEGIALNDTFNGILKGNLVTSDGDLHNKLRRIIGGPMLPGALVALTERVQGVADALVDTLIAKGSFDGVKEVAYHLPFTLVREFVGLSEEGRENMLNWAAAAFDCLGPMNERNVAAQAILGEATAYIQKCVSTRAVTPGSWGDGIFKAHERGEVTLEQASVMLMDYIFPALDTTINATSTLLLHMAKTPEQWEILRADPSLIPAAINEAVRIESPIRQFSRLVKTDHVIDGVTLKAGSRALMMYSSANHDDRKWDDPERYDIRRNNVDHLGFGHGVHQCAGMHLARLEITCLLKAMLPRINAFRLTGEPTYGVNNVIRGLASLPLSIS